MWVPYFCRGPKIKNYPPIAAPLLGPRFLFGRLVAKCCIHIHGFRYISSSYEPNKGSHGHACNLGMSACSDCENQKNGSGI